MFFKLLDYNAKAEDFVWLLNDLRLELGRKLHVVWDNLGAHRKAENFFHEIDWPWARFHRLPPTLPNSTPSSTSGRRASGARWPTPRRTTRSPPNGRLNDELTRQATQQRILRGHFRWAELDLR